MELMKLLLVSVIATSFMTGFSYVFYYITGKEAREPFLLNYIISRKLPYVAQNKFYYSAIGWVIHYALGIGFVFFNELLFYIFKVPRTLIWGIPFGVIAGIVGIIGWMFMFKLAEHLPKINYTYFYAQLVVAHIIFCLCAIAFGKLFSL